MNWKRNLFYNEPAPGKNDEIYRLCSFDSGIGTGGGAGREATGAEKGQRAALIAALQGYSKYFTGSVNEQDEVYVHSLVSGGGNSLQPGLTGKSFPIFSRHSRRYSEHAGSGVSGRDLPDFPVESVTNSNVEFIKTPLITLEAWFLACLHTSYLPVINVRMQRYTEDLHPG